MTALAKADKVVVSGGVQIVNVSEVIVVQHDEAAVVLYQVTWSMSDSDTCKREIDDLLEASKQTECDNLYIITKEGGRRIGS